MPKIDEIDQFLRTYLNARPVVREVHPEVLFWALNGGSQLVHKKKSRDGFEERMEVLRRLDPRIDEITSWSLSQWKRKEVARDDILDALAAAVTANLGNGVFETVPDDPEVDDEGLPMEMVYVRANHSGGPSTKRHKQLSLDGFRRKASGT